MSHFSVIVIGADHESQLAPYHEFECTGVNDKFVQDVDITAEVREHMTGDDADTLDDALSYYGLEDRIVSDESEIDTGTDEEEDAPHKYGYAIVKDGHLVKAVKRTNPNKKWDWWVVGGRWSGFLKLKTGRRADQCLKSAVDFEGMRDEAGQKAAAQWDKACAAKVAAGYAENTTWNTWEHVREVLHPGNIDAAREAYNAQPVLEAVRKAMAPPWGGVDEYLTPRGEYIQRARDRAVVPYALVKDGEWIAKGRMGWCGMSDDKVSQDEWNRKVSELLDSLPDDTLLTVVDCHI